MANFLATSAGRAFDQLLSVFPQNSRIKLTDDVWNNTHQNHSNTAQRLLLNSLTRWSKRINSKCKWGKWTSLRPNSSNTKESLPPLRAITCWFTNVYLPRKTMNLWFNGNFMTEFLCGYWGSLCSTAWQLEAESIVVFLLICHWLFACCYVLILKCTYNYTCFYVTNKLNSKQLHEQMTW